MGDLAVVEKKVSATKRWTPHEGSVRRRLARSLRRVTGVGPREEHSSLSTNGIEGPRIDTQGFEDGRRHLGGTHRGADRAGLEGRIGQQQHDVRVVMGEATVLLLLCRLPE